MYGTQHNEDAVLLRSVPEGFALVQSVDVLAPISRSPYTFGRIAACNALSDIYAMGGEAWSAMNIVSFPTCSEPTALLSEILAGGISMLNDADCVLAGGHTLEEASIKYGLSVTGYIDPKKCTRNDALKEGDVLVLTKPIGSGVLATAINGDFGDVEAYEKTLALWATRLNRNAASVMRKMNIKAATDITGFGLGGHATEMAEASQCTLRFFLDAIPFMDGATELAAQGFIPAASYANRKYGLNKCRHSIDFSTSNSEDNVRLSLFFDSQTSGGLLMAVPEKDAKEALARLEDGGDGAWVVGTVEGYAGEEDYVIVE